MKIAILYICTGQYSVFWDEFYKSFELFFLPGIEKEYFVFTDREELSGAETGKVHLQKMPPQPWPVPTLLKYHTFLLMEEKLRKFDYIYQPNANSRCVREVHAEEFLPRVKKGEELFFTMHPARLCVNDYEYPYCRVRQSQAYVPYCQKAIGVFGAMNGGVADAYIDFMHELAGRTAIDLKKCIIPIHHDESYVNNYLVRHLNDGKIRILSSDYAYPQEYNIACDRIIELRDKNLFFDAAGMKQVVCVKKKSFSIRGVGRIIVYAKKLIRYYKGLKDSVFKRTAN